MKIDRSKYLGGSDAAAIIGVDRFKTVHDVYLDKLGQGTERDQNEAMFWGSTLEAVVRKEYRKRTGRYVRPRTVRHPDHPFIAGHVDGEGDALLEVKVARDGADWGPDGESDITAIPVYYRPQLVHYMLASGRDSADMAVLVRGQELRIYPDIPKPRWADDLLAEEVRFWNDHVLAGVPPEIDGSEGAGRMLRKRFPVDDGSELVALPEQYPLLEALRLARQNAEQATANERSLEQAIQAAMGEASYLLGPNVKISWKKPKDSVIVDWKGYAESLEKAVQIELEALERGDQAVTSLPLELHTIEGLDTLKSLYTSTRPGSRRFLVHFTEAEGSHLT